MEKKLYSKEHPVDLIDNSIEKTKEIYIGRQFINFTCEKCNSIFSRRLSCIYEIPKLCFACQLRKKLSKPKKDLLMSNCSESIEQIKEYKNIEFKCPKCSKLERKRVKSFILSGLFLCRNCLHEKISLEKFGTRNPAQSPKVQEKIKNTNIKKYGVINVLKSPQIRRKIELTNLKKYGTANVFESEIIKEKIKETVKLRYGVDSIAKVEEIKQKVVQSNMKRYGVKCSLQAESVKNKIEQTNLKKYGAKHFSQSKYASTAKTNYSFNSLNFDSSWELAFYIYYIDHNFKVIRAPCSIDYSYEGSQHKYFPDFKIQNRIFEIKGPQFFNEDGNMIDPFDSSGNVRAAAKYKCMLSNNVIIITDCSKYLDYVNSKYGKDFLRSCRTENA